jgi:DNA repair protein RadC
VNYSVAVVQLPLVRESDRQPVRTPADAHRICADIAGLAQESLHVLSLDAKNRLLNRSMVSLGLVSSCTVHAREVFRQAIADGASSVVILHNHPTGDPTPSAEDVRITKTLVGAGKVLDVRVLDHVVVGRPAGDEAGGTERPPFVSMRESGICSFDQS